MTYEPPPKPTGVARLWTLPSGYRRIYWHDHVLTIYTPRLWRWSFAVFVRFGVEFLLGVLIYRDEDGDRHFGLGLGPVEIMFAPCRMWTRREARKRERARGLELVSEVEAHLREVEG